MKRIQTITYVVSMKRRITSHAGGHWWHRSLLPAWRGIRTAFSSGSNLKRELFLAAMAVMAGLILRIGLTQWALIIVAAGLVFTAEMLNTSVELLADRVNPAYDRTIGTLKDIAAGAVLLAAFASLLISALVFIPEISALL